jgi:hypothetical protein
MRCRAIVAAKGYFIQFHSIVPRSEGEHGMARGAAASWFMPSGVTGRSIAATFHPGLAL